MGGLTAGLALARHGYSVDILEKDSEAGQMDRARHNVGLWSPSLACLERLGVLGGLDLVYTTVSGYRDVAGNSLAAPTFTLDSFRDGGDLPSLAFVDERQLLGRLRRDAVRSGARIVFGEAGGGGEREVGLCRGHTSGERWREM